MSKYLYVTADGVLEPLGFSQVLRVVEGLSRRGHGYVLLSLEKPTLLRDRGSVDRVRKRLADAGVEWVSLPFRVGGGPRAAASNLASATVEAIRLARRHQVHLTHARAYHGAVMALAIKRVLGIPYLFDTRSYWIDERAEASAWPTSSLRYRAAKLVERTLYAAAAGAVTLTELQADDLRANALGPWRDRPLEVITTVADFDEFTLDRAPLPPDVAPVLEGRPVLGWIGSLNPSYLVAESCTFLKEFTEQHPNGIVVALTAQVDACRETFARAGIDPRRMLVRNVPHPEMRQWLPWLDWAVLFLKSSFSKRASMPTKLAEFFACGVRPLHHGCNSEVAAWIRKTGSGMSVESLDAGTLREAARRIEPRSPGAAAQLAHARELALPHFSLSAGLARYDRILSQLTA